MGNLIPCLLALLNLSFQFYQYRLGFIKTEPVSILDHFIKCHLKRLSYSQQKGEIPLLWLVVYPNIGPGQITLQVDAPEHILASDFVSKGRWNNFRQFA